MRFVINRFNKFMTLLFCHKCFFKEDGTCQVGPTSNLVSGSHTIFVFGIFPICFLNEVNKVNKMLIIIMLEFFY